MTNIANFYAEQLAVNFHALKQIDYETIEQEIKFVSPLKLEEIDGYFNCVRTLNREEHQIWRLIKKSLIIIWNFYELKHDDWDKLIKAFMCLDIAVKKGIPNSIKANLIISS